MRVGESFASCRYRSARVPLYPRSAERPRIPVSRARGTVADTATWNGLLPRCGIQLYGQNRRASERTSIRDDRAETDERVQRLSLSLAPPCRVPGEYRGIRPRRRVRRSPPEHARGSRRPRDSETDLLPKSLTHVQRTHFTPCFSYTAHRSQSRAGTRAGELPAGAAPWRGFSEVTRVTGSRQEFSLSLSFFFSFSFFFRCSIRHIYFANNVQYI